MQRQGHENYRLLKQLNFHKLLDEITVRGELHRLHHLCCFMLEDSLHRQVRKSVLHRRHQPPQSLQYSRLQHFLLRPFPCHSHGRQQISLDRPQQQPIFLAFRSHKISRNINKRKQPSQFLTGSL